MKKIVFSLIIVILILGVTSGCNSNKKERDIIYKSLTKEKILNKDLKLIDTVLYVNSGITPYRETYYIYEDKDSNLIAIKYNTYYDSELDYKYSAEIYNNVKLEEKDIEYIDNTETVGSYYSYEDGTISLENKYSFDNKKEYLVSEKKTFIFTKYTVNEKTKETEN